MESKISMHSLYFTSATTMNTVVLNFTTHMEGKQLFYSLSSFVKFISES